MPAVLLADEAGNLTLRIAGGEGELDYRVEFCPPGLDDWAVKLHGGGGPYRVARSPGGRWTCPCKDRWRARREVRLCKHRNAVKALYLALLKALPHVHRQEQEETLR